MSIPITDGVLLSVMERNRAEDREGIDQRQSRGVEQKEMEEDGSGQGVTGKK